MNETRDLLERVGGRFQFPDEAFDRMLRRRDRKRRNKRIASGLLGLVLVIGIMLLLGSALLRTGPHRRPAQWPTPSGTAVPILRAGEVVERGPDGQRLVATDTATGHQRALARCRGCVFIGNFALSADRAWVAWDVVTCGGACTPAKIANEGVWIAGVDGVPRQLTKLCLWSWSPVAPQLACARTGDNGSELFLVDPADGARTRIATSEGAIGAVAWAPDGRSIAYGVAPLSLPFKPAKGRGSTGVYIVRSGARPVQLTEAQVESGALVSGITWSPDGIRLALEVYQGDRDRLVIIGVDGNDRRTLLDRPAFEGTGPPVWSPDGRRIAYFGTPGSQSGYALEVRVIDPDGGQPVRLARIGGSPDSWDGPVWSPDSRLVAYAVGDVRKWFAAVADGSASPEPIDRLEVLRWRQGPGS